MTAEAECLDALREAAERLGESPTKAQYEELGTTPASATIIRTIGGWNEAKERAGLETNPSTGSRVGPKPDGVDLPDGASWDELSVDQRWHYRNVGWNTERSLRRRSRLRSWLNGIKRERACSRCHEDTAACLDFHHVDTAAKEMAVGKMVTFGYGKERLREEIEKCEVLCANCHRQLHFTEPDDERRRWVHDRKRSAGCDRCGESDSACLDYHHDNERKEASITRLSADGRTKARIRAEMERCTVLCSNCHRQEHYEPPEGGRHDHE